MIPALDPRRPAADLAADAEARAALREKLRDRQWRLNNLYRIANKDGIEVTFRLTPVQQQLDDELHNRNIVPKSRQHGITTYACIRALDTAVFRSGSKCGLVFHKKEEAIKAFRTKVLYAYDRLPAWLRAERPVVRRDLTGGLELKNGSTIECSTSHRGGTLQYLHISEYGPMVAMFPLRAEEVASGALNTLAPDTICTIESTAMGAWGDFYERVQTAKELQKMIDGGQARLTQLDYKLFFFGWWQDPTNRLKESEVKDVDIPEKMHRYFDELERKFEARIFPAQRAWYVKKQIEQKHKMKREHPSTLDEAFEGSVEGAYYANELSDAAEQGRICDLPFIKSLPVHTFWDIGRNDSTAIWFMQEVGPWLHFIRFYENSGHGAAHYGGVLRKLRDELGYVYGTHYLPHDAGVADWSISDNKTRKQVVEDMKIGRVEVVPRIESLPDGIEMTRQMLNRCKFDKTECGENPPGSGRGGLPSLHAYRRGFDIRSQTWEDHPMKGWQCHGADAIRQAAQAYSMEGVPNPSGKKRRRRGDSRDPLTR